MASITLAATSGAAAAVVQQQSTQSPEKSLDLAASQGIKLIRSLRSAVKNTFDVGITVNEDYGETGGDNTAKNIRQCLQNVQDCYEGIEKVFASLPKQPVALLQNNSQVLSLNKTGAATEPSDDVLSTYTWMKKVQDYSSYAYLFLGQHARRSQGKLFKKPQGSLMNTAPHFVQNVFTTLEKLYPGMEFKFVQHGRNAYLFIITLPNVMRVAVVFRGLVMEWANVIGIGESFYDDEGKLEIRRQSNFIVFQKLTIHLRGALLYFSESQTLSYPHVAIKSFVNCIQAYKNLFSEPCQQCKKILKDYLPPVYRDVKTTAAAAFHESCKS